MIKIYLKYTRKFVALTQRTRSSKVLLYGALRLQSLLRHLVFIILRLITIVEKHIIHIIYNYDMAVSAKGCACNQAQAARANTRVTHHALGRETKQNQCVLPHDGPALDFQRIA